MAESKDAVDKLGEAVKTLSVGPATEPRHHVGAVIDREAQQRILAEIQRAARDGDGRLVAQADVSHASGFVVPPTVFVDVDPQSKLAQDEIFGPVLAVVEQSKRRKMESGDSSSSRQIDWEEIA